jgi:hypothetical protein
VNAPHLQIPAAVASGSTQSGVERREGMSREAALMMMMMMMMTMMTMMIMMPP